MLPLIPPSPLPTCTALCAGHATDTLLAASLCACMMHRPFITGPCRSIGEDTMLLELTKENVDKVLEDVSGRGTRVCGLGYGG